MSIVTYHESNYVRVLDMHVSGTFLGREVGGVNLLLNFAGKITNLFVHK